MNYFDDHPELYPPTVQWALIRAEAKWRDARRIALEHAEAFDLARELAPMWRGKEPATFYFNEPGGASLWGILLRVTLHGNESMKDVAPMIERLMDAGWKVGDGEDYAEIKRRNFRCTKGKAAINLMVFAESESCRVIEDGTVPNLKLICGDAA